MTEMAETKHEEKSDDNLNAPRKMSKHVRMDSALGTQQVGQLKVAFNLFDKDQNGVIDQNELTTVLKTLGQTISKEEIEEMVAAVDQNDDGEIDFNEFVTMMEKRMFLPSNTLEYQDAFKFFDKNGDGFIDFNELKDVLLSLGEQFTNQDIQDMIDEADKSGNGKVGFEEFIAMMPSTMKVNYQKCKQKEANYTSGHETITDTNIDIIDNDKDTYTKTEITEPEEQEEEEESNSYIPAGNPTKR
eukprot:778888_1